MTELKNGWWKAIAIGSLAVNLTVIGLTATWIQVASDHMTVSETQTLIDASVTYPWNIDRALVMNHLTDLERHENDTAKRKRIRDEVDPALAGLEQRLDSRLKAIEVRLDLLLGNERNK